MECLQNKANDIMLNNLVVSKVSLHVDYLLKVPLVSTFTSMQRLTFCLGLCDEF